MSSNATPIDHTHYTSTDSLEFIFLKNSAAILKTSEISLANWDLSWRRELTLSRVRTELRKKLKTVSKDGCFSARERGRSSLDT